MMEFNRFHVVFTGLSTVILLFSSRCEVNCVRVKVTRRKDGDVLAFDETIKVDCSWMKSKCLGNATVVKNGREFCGCCKCFRRSSNFVSSLGRCENTNGIIASRCRSLRWSTPLLENSSNFINIFGRRRQPSAIHSCTVKDANPEFLSIRKNIWRRINEASFFLQRKSSGWVVSFFNDSVSKMSTGYPGRIAKINFCCKKQPRGKCSNYCMVFKVRGMLDVVVSSAMIISEQPTRLPNTTSSLTQYKLAATGSKITSHNVLPVGNNTSNYNKSSSRDALNKQVFWIIIRLVIVALIITLITFAACSKYKKRARTAKEKALQAIANGDTPKFATSSIEMGKVNQIEGHIYATIEDMRIENPPPSSNIYQNLNVNDKGECDVHHQSLERPLHDVQYIDVLPPADHEG